jgi:hypothetical protein
MINFIFILLILIFFQSCNSQITSTNVSANNYGLYRDSIIKVSNIDNYLKLYTKLSYDTLSEESSFNNKFSSPFIVNQKLVFCSKEGIILKEIELKFKKRKLLTTSKHIEFSPVIYLWDICLLKTPKRILYYIYGSGLCNGLLCPEYFALYDKSGSLVGEGYSNEYAKKFNQASVDALEKKLGFRINDASNCININHYWK